MSVVTPEAGRNPPKVHLRRISAAVLVGTLLSPFPAAAAPEKRTPSWCGTTREGGREAVLRHLEQQARRGGELRAANASSNYDVGNVAVLQDDGDLMLLRNLMDLQGVGLQFTPQGTSAFSVVRADRSVSGDATGTGLTLGDDATVEVSLPFAFPYHDKQYASVFVNSDGNLTFGAGDAASTVRSLSRLVGGPPRVAPLLADLDPTAGGSITTRADASRFTVTWTDVAQFGLRDKNTFEVTLYPDGRIEFAYGAGLTRGIDLGVVGIAPGGNQGPFTALDLSTAAGATGTVLAESFSSRDGETDDVAVARKFFQTHADDYDQLVVFFNRSFQRSGGYFAYFEHVKQTDGGIGLPLVDFASSFGSNGRLEGFVNMDWALKYPDDFASIALFFTSALSILGQESGHRWGAFVNFKDGASNSQELLGRDQAHWSFYMNSDASHLEGNKLEDLGGGRFRTVESVARFSLLDQYLMGLIPPEAVPPFFFVRPNPQGDSGRSPETGVEFTGARKDVTIQDVIAAMGPRTPPATAKPPLRQAFIFVSRGPVDPAQLDKIERFRAAWVPYFQKSTDGRWSVDTTLR